MDNNFGKYLHHYYKKRIRSILIGMDKIKKKYNAEAIHQLRVDIKKVKVLFQLFELTDPKNFKAKEYKSIFKNIFKLAGKIRELQIIEQYHSPVFKVPLYKEFIEKKGKKYRHKLKKEIAGFDTKKENRLEHEIKKMCEKSSKEMIIKRSGSFIAYRIDKINEVLCNTVAKDLHKARKHLKGITLLSSIVLKLKGDKEPGQSLRRLTKTEKSIGGWHDRLIFEKSLNKFLKKKQLNSGKEASLLKNRLTEISKKNQKEIPVIKKRLQKIFTDFK
jgi:CHAD domain-containing protein